MDIPAEPLLAEGHRFNRKRTYKDVAWTVTYAVFLVLIAAGGLYSYFNRY